MPKLQQRKATGQYFLNLPKELVEAKKWEKGQKLLVAYNEKGNLEIQAVE